MFKKLLSFEFGLPFLAGIIFHSASVIAAEAVVLECDKDLLVSQSQSSGEFIPAPNGSSCVDALADLTTMNSVTDFKVTPSKDGVVYTAILENGAGTSSQRLISGIANVPGSPGTIGGYAAADQQCDAVFEGSAVCTVQEVFNSMRAGGPLASGFVNTGIIQNGLSTNVADCEGWTDNDGTAVGFNPGATPAFVVTSCSIPFLNTIFLCCR